jgi:hypothetical protein
MNQREATCGADFWICRVVRVALFVDLSESGLELLWHSFQSSAIIHVIIAVRSFSDPSFV